MKKRFLLPLLAMLLSGAKVNIPSQEYVTLNAATPMPTKINMENSTDLEVSTYYDGVNGKSGDTLLGFLYTKIKDHNEYDYENNTHRFIYKIIDRNWELDAIDPKSKANTENFDYTNDNGFIHKLYADYNDDINTADRFRNEGASRVSFDKEHMWPQSLGNFGRTGGAGSDFHSLWPSDVKGNQQAHSNYSFGIPETGVEEFMNDYGTFVGRNGYIAGSPNKVFEPLDQYKGDVARAMFYMPARYYEYVDALHPKLELVNSSPNGHTASTSITGKAGVLTTLLEWHELDPVDDYEIKRNNLIANNYQMNRNPFIDYPQWARIAYDPSYSGSGAINTLETSSVGVNQDLVKEAKLLSIELNTTSVKKAFAFNEKFTSTGLTVRGVYDNGITQRVSSFTTSIASGSALTTAGDQVITVTVTHNGESKTATYNISVAEEEKLDLMMIAIVGGVALVVLILFIIIFLSLSKKNKKKVVKALKKTAKKQVKKSTKRK
ncbi:MAG: endonuclease [Bacilli bacterium]|nr:endonuclease [Bacilli bacterium]